MLSTRLWGIPSDLEVDSFQSIDDLKAWTKAQFAEIRKTHEILGEVNSANIEQIVRLSKIPSDEIIREIESKDRAANTGLILRHLGRFQEPIVLLDHSLTLTPLR